MRTRLFAIILIVASAAGPAFGSIESSRRPQDASEIFRCRALSAKAVHGIQMAPSSAQWLRALYVFRDERSNLMAAGFQEQATRDYPNPYVKAQPLENFGDTLRTVVSVTARCQYRLTTSSSLDSARRSLPVVVEIWGRNGGDPLCGDALTEVNLLCDRVK